MKKVVLIAGLIVGLAANAHAAPQDFSAWLLDFKAEAKEQGIPEKLLDRTLPATLEPIARIIELDRKQPDSSVKYEDYIVRIVNKARVDVGREKMGHYRTLLKNVSAAYGVEPEVLVALWGVETNYGRNAGGFEVTHALATLAYDGRRSKYFRGELFKALQILNEGHIPPHRMKGSWAGAMGQNQFMPSSFFNFAEDFNKDGRRDIWTTEADVFASSARYLAESGWKKGQPWGYEVHLPAGLERSLIGPQSGHPVSFWHGKAVTRANGDALDKDGSELASLIQPGGVGTKAFLVHSNYKVILLWNRSHYFATSVGLLADKLKS